MKHGILLSVLLAFAFSASLAMSQEGSSDRKNPNLPNAPSATEAVTCTQNNGKPCPEWLHKLIGQYLPLPESAAHRPKRDPSTVHIWTYRGSEDPPLRNNHEVFRSWFFDGTHIGGMIAVMVACHTKNSGETCGSGAIVLGTLFGMDYLQFRFVGGPNAIGAPIYEMVHYGLASAR